MDEALWVESFECNRARLAALAYRMLGSRQEAEEAVQDCWLRAGSIDPEVIANPAGWFTTVVSRLCLDRLRSRRSRPEFSSERVEEIGPPVADNVPDPEHEALLSESMEAALLVVLDRLTPAERIAFVLHDVFALPFGEVAEVLGRSPDATRQLASRARRRVRGGGGAGAVDLVRRRQIVTAFIAAARSGDLEGLVAVLDPEVVLRPDATSVRLGSFAETRGADGVARLISGGAQAARPALVGGLPGIAWAPGGRVRGAIAFDITDDRIVGIEVIADAAHLEQLDVVVLDA